MEAGVVSHEPRLSSGDHKIWSIWRTTALVHSTTKRYRHHVNRALENIRLALQGRPSWAVMWSGGKDSTALAHLALQVDPTLELVSEKDDLDFPGERAYVKSLAASWGAGLTILEPQQPLADWLQHHGTTLLGDEDMHSRGTGMGQHFYDIVEEYTKTRPIMLGLRKEESRGRLLSRVSNGVLYQRKTRQWVSTPIADWSGLDVYAYLFTNEIPILPLYQCTALMHAEEPWRIRKAWWVPGRAGARGQAMWLRHYYPSLYRQFAELVPHVRYHLT